MKKTRFEKFMLAATKKALNNEGLDTYKEHLNYTRLLIELELAKFGGSGKTVAKSTPKARSRVDQVSGALGTAKRTLIRIGTGLTKIYGFLTTGNNFMIVFIGMLFLYAVLIMALGLI